VKFSPPVCKNSCTPRRRDARIHGRTTRKHNAFAAPIGGGGTKNHAQNYFDSNETELNLPLFFSLTEQLKSDQPPVRVELTQPVRCRDVWASDL